MKSLKICVVRLSALGDVAMLVPVLDSFVRAYPQHEVCVVTRQNFAPLFTDIQNVTLVFPDLYDKHKGVRGLFNFFRELKKSFKPDIFLDLHDVLRTKILRKYFAWSRTKVFVFNKGRAEKRALTRTENKVRKPLKHTSERYADSFRAAGFDFKIEFLPKKYSLPEGFKFQPQKKKIGIAPFAAHRGKMYPEARMRDVIKYLSDLNFQIFIFGGGASEKMKAHGLERDFKTVKSLIGRFSLSDEIAVMSHLDAMVVPDSGNMHLAALAGVPIVSIWGATHPFAGFTPVVSSKIHSIVQLPDLACRPCSVFGEKPCYKGTWECLTGIKPGDVMRGVFKVFK